MNSSINHVMSSFNKCINDVKSIEGALTNPNKDFTRLKKLSYKDLVKLIICFSGGTLFDEINDYFGVKLNNITTSGLVQARSKITPLLFESLFHRLNKCFKCEKIFKGYHLIAIDGSDLCVPFDINDSNAYIRNKGDSKPYSSYHINAAYDILESRYVDCLIQPSRLTDERKAMNEFITNYSHDNTIFIADRGYPSWNIMATCNKLNRYYLIRERDINDNSSRIKKFNILEEEYDKNLSVILTNKQTLAYKDNRYRFLSSSSRFDYLDDNNEYLMNFRAIRFKLSGDNYEVIITNLPESISVEDIKELYRIRWSIETSFRTLKYSADLNSFHSKRRDFVYQEIWASMIMCNISSIITNLVFINTIRKKIHEYQCNKTNMIKLIRIYLRKRSALPVADLVELIAKQLLPVRKDRKFERNKRPKGNISFNYRFN